MARHSIRASESGIYESETVRVDDFARFVRDVRRAGGTITRSAPVGAGYAVTVYYA